MSESLDYLKFLCIKGWETKIATMDLTDEQYAQYAERLRHELSLIGQANLEDYFLIVWDILRYCDEFSILKGPGRGSVGGSLVAYLTGITKIDSVKYSCLFSRFFNIGRMQTGSLADIDMDIDHRYLDQVIQYIRSKYGNNNVAAISTVVKMYGKTSIKDVSRSLALGYGGVGTAVDRTETFALANKITDEFPKVTNVAEMPIEEALKNSYELRVYEQKYKEVFDYARRLEGLVRSNSMHPAGLIISSQPLIEHLPMKKVRNKDVDDDEIERTLDVADVDMKVLESRKFLKFDLLKLKTLSVIDDTFKLIKERHGVTVTQDSIDLEDVKVYEYIWHSPNLLGIFQFESAGMNQLVKKVKPRNIEDLAHCNALYRPGPMDSGTLAEYVRRRQGLEPVTFDAECLEPVLKNTQGLPIFQEQIIQIAQVFSGFSEQEADILRSAIGKKNDKKMASLKSKFINGAVAKGHTDVLAQELFAVIEKSGRYAFNKPHSIAYSILAYYTLWLKYYYRAEFITASINNEKTWDKIALFIFDAKCSGLNVLPLDVSRSKIPFTIVSDTEILTGYKAVKGAGDVSTEVIAGSGPYATFNDFLDKTHYAGSKINSAVVSAINACGGFERLGVTRSQVEEYYKMASIIAKKDYPTKAEKIKNYLIKQNLPGIDPEELTEKILAANTTECVASLLLKRNINFINKLLTANYSSKIDELNKLTMPIVDDWDIQRKCREEKLFLGYFVSGHPTHQYVAASKNHVAYIDSMVDGDDLDMIVFVDSLDKSKVVTGGKKLYKYTISDESGSVELTSFVNPDKQAPVTVGTIAHIIGAVNTFNGKNSVRLKFVKTVYSSNATR